MLLLFNVLVGQEVNTFSGDFTYRKTLITLPGTGGLNFPIELIYQSNNPASASASWVGFGWNIPIGSISRTVKGYPDDWRAAKITFFRKGQNSFTASNSNRIAIEYSSKSNLFDEEPSPLSSGASSKTTKFLTQFLRGGGGYSLTSTFDSQSGLWKGTGVDIGLLGLANFNFTSSDQSDEPGNMKTTQNQFRVSLSTSLIPGYDNVMSYKSLSSSGGLNFPISRSGYKFRIPSLGYSDYETHTWEYFLNPQFFYSWSTGRIGVEYEYKQSASSRIYKESSDKLVRGFFYNEPETDENSEEISNQLLDYYNERDNSYQTGHMLMSIPFPNRDVYNVSAFNVSGSFELSYLFPQEFYPAKNSYQTKDHFSWSSQEFGLGLLHFMPALNYDFSNLLRQGLSSSGTNKTEIGKWETDKLIRGNFFGRESLDFTRKKFIYSGDVIGNFEQSDNDNPEKFITEGAISQNFGPSRKSEIFGGKREVRFVKFSERSSKIERLTNDQKTLDFVTITTVESLESQKLNANDQRKKELDEYIAQTKILKDEIAEFAVKSDDGSMSVFGLPVFSRRERSYRIGLSNRWIADPSDPNDNPNKNVANRLIFCDVNEQLENEDVLSGEKRDVPYVSEYLLTEIRSADYVDCTKNGPSQDDYGDYVKFNYRRVAGSNDKITNEDVNAWFKWRSPENGLQFDQGSLSESSDDFGIVNYGQKEIYYIESIETKTHKVFFVSNTTELGLNDGKIVLNSRSNIDYRLDGYCAHESELYNCSNEFATTSIDKSGNQHFISTNPRNIVEKLEKIVLYPIEAREVSASISAVKFETDYSLMSSANKLITGNLPYNIQKEELKTLGGVVNSGLIVKTNGTQIEVTRAGKLTLKSIRFHGPRGILKRGEAVSFRYTPKSLTSFNLSLVNKYSDVLSGQNQILSTNPTYDRKHIDSWGFMDSRVESDIINNGFDWKNQSPMNSSYNPSAYNLFSIEHENGSDILIQYEEKNYRKVQNKEAFLMLGLSEDNSENENSTFKISADKIFRGINVSDGNYEPYEIPLMEYTNKLQQEFLNKNKKVYFKFLYRLRDEPETNVNLAQDFKRPWDGSERLGKVEYITGFVSIKSIEADCSTNSIPFLKLVLEEASTSSYHLKTPKSVCLDFVYKNKRGRLFGDERNNIFRMPWQTRDGNNIDYSSLCSELSAIENEEFDFENDKYCKKISFLHSYIRLPLPDKENKVGGGVRVKRVLFVDGGIAGQYSSVSGKEYRYTSDLSSNISSGVATNEPERGREENPIFDVLENESLLNDKFRQSIICGSDMLRVVGPLAEGLYPGPSIGYSNVFELDINSFKVDDNHDILNIRPDQSKQNSFRPNGIKKRQYYTVNDFPSVKVEWTNVDFSDSSPFFQNLSGNVAAGLGSGIMPGTSALGLSMGGSSHVEVATSKQGFVCSLQNRNGVLISEKTYSGFTNDPGKWTLQKSISNEFYNEVDNIPVSRNANDLYSFYSENSSTLLHSRLGQFIEVFAETRLIKDVLKLPTVGLDIAATIVPPMFDKATIDISYNSSLKAYRGAVVNKIVKRPFYLKQQVLFSDGLVDTVKNVCFDYFTRNPLIIRRSNQFSFSKNQQNRVYSVSVPAFYHYSDLGPSSLLESQVFTESNIAQIDVNGKKTYNISLTSPSVVTKRFHAGDLLKLQSPTASFLVYVESVEGNMLRVRRALAETPLFNFNGSLSKIQTIWSGATNQLNEVAQTWTFVEEQNPNTTPLNSNLLRQKFLSNSVTIFTNFVGNEQNHQVKLHPFNQGVNLNDDYSTGYNRLSDYVFGLRRSFKPYASYIYQKNVDLTSGLHIEVDRDFGYYTDVKKFDFTNIESNKLANGADGGFWMRTDSITKFSIVGNETEKINQLGIFESNRNAFQPTDLNIREGINKLNTNSIRSLNCRYGESDFCSFEGASWFKENKFSIEDPIRSGFYTNTEKRIDATTLNNKFSHAGSQALEIWNSNSKRYMGVRVQPQRTQDRKFYTRFWAKLYVPPSETNRSVVYTNDWDFENSSTESNNTVTFVCPVLDYPSNSFIAQHPGSFAPSIIPDALIQSNSGGGGGGSDPNTKIYHNAKCNKVAIVGDWTLCECNDLEVQNDYTAGSNTIELYIQKPNVYGDVAQNQQTVFLVDDVVLQPYESISECNVLNGDYSLAAKFDQNHFATFPQKSANGAVVREYKETVNGVKLVKEQQTNSAHSFVINSVVDPNNPPMGLRRSKSESSAYQEYSPFSSIEGPQSLPSESNFQISKELASLNLSERGVDFRSYNPQKDLNELPEISILDSAIDRQIVRLTELRDSLNKTASNKIDLDILQKKLSPYELDLLVAEYIKNKENLELKLQETEAKLRNAPSKELELELNEIRSQVKKIDELLNKVKFNIRR